MTDAPQDRTNDASGLSPSERIDQVCNQFKAAWQAGETPQIEEYLTAWQGSLRTKLLENLLCLELDLRRRDGEHPEAEEYLSRFSEDADLVGAVFGRAETVDRVLDQMGETADFSPLPLVLKIRCPHCQNPIELVEDRPLVEMTCPSCGSSFSLMGNSAEAGAVATGSSIAHFKLIEQLGTGSFGTVWKARDTHLDRIVALKIPRRSQLDAEDVDKFFREARAASQLNHSNIVSVHEVGRDGETVFIVSDFVEGLSLDAWIEDQQIKPHEAAQLCRKIALALHHAHEAGVVHRDLKPSNIMIDSDGEPHVMDFGLAKREAGEITMTVEGHILGTPAYMSPEQARGEGYKADRRSDVYSLGVILYELLTGERPFRGNIRMLLKQVIEDEPTPPHKLDARIPKDLETIALKCLEKDPSKRYATADSLAEELRRYARGEPIQARPISATARAWRWCNRNQLVASLSAAVFLVLVVGLIGVSYFAIEATLQSGQKERALTQVASERDRADGQATLARQKAREALDEKQRADEKAMLAEQEAAAAREAEEEADMEAYRANVSRHGFQMAAALKAWQEKDIIRAEQILTEVSPSFQDNWETRHIASLCWRTARPLRGHTSSVNSVCFSPDGQTIASASGYLQKPGEIKLWDVKSGQEKRTLTGHTDRVTSVCFSPDGLTIASGSSDKTLKLWDAKSGQEKRTLKGNIGSIACVCFSPDSQTIAGGIKTQVPAFPDPRELRADKIKLWDAKSGQEKLTLIGHNYGVNSVCFSPDGQTILTGGADKKLKLSNANTGQEKLTLEGDTYFNSVCFSPDGQTILSGGSAGTLQLWDVESGQEKLTLKGNSVYVNSVCFSPDGQTFLSGDSDGTLKLWDAKSGEEKFVARGDAHSVESVSFGPDGQTFLSGGGDKVLRIWNAKSGQEKLTLNGHTSNVSSGSFSPDGQTILSGVSIKAFKLWDAKTGQEKLTVAGSSAACFSPDGQTILSGSTDSNFKLWDAKTGQEKLTLKGHSAIGRLCFSPDGRMIASSSMSFFLPKNQELRPGKILLCDALSGRVKNSLVGVSNGFSNVCFSPDGQSILSECHKSSLGLWDAKTLEEKLTFEGHTHTVTSVCFSPDGQTIASGSLDESIRLWDAQSGQQKLALMGHAGGVESVCYSPDGQTLLSGSKDGTLKLWDALTGHEKLTLKGHTKSVKNVCFSPDGQTILSGSLDGTIKLWEAPTSLSGSFDQTRKPQNAPPIPSGSIDQTRKLQGHNDKTEIDKDKTEIDEGMTEHVKGKILIDASKGVRARWYPQGKNFGENEHQPGKPLADVLRAKGYSVKEVARGVTVTPELLRSSELVLRSRSYSPYQASEIDAYEEAIQEGLLVLFIAQPMRDELSSRLEFDISPVQELGNITSARKHSLAQSLLEIEGQWATFENMPKDATSLVSIGSGRSVATVRMLGKGLVMVIGAPLQQSSSVIENLIFELTSKPATELKAEIDAAEDEVQKVVGPKAPQTVAPEEGAVLPQGKEAIWRFEWSATDGAVEYELIVFGARAVLPIVKIKTKETRYEKEHQGGRIIGLHKKNWAWGVRARDAQGNWGNWSTNSKFDVE